MSSWPSPQHQSRGWGTRQPRSRVNSMRLAWCRGRISFLTLNFLISKRRARHRRRRRPQPHTLADRRPAMRRGIRTQGCDNDRDDIAASLRSATHSRPCRAAPLTVHAAAPTRHRQPRSVERLKFVERTCVWHTPRACNVEQGRCPPRYSRNRPEIARRGLP